MDQRGPRTRLTFSADDRERLAELGAAILAGLRGCDRERATRILRRCGVSSRPALMSLLRRCGGGEGAVSLEPNEVVVLVSLLAAVAPDRAIAPLDEALEGLGKPAAAVASADPHTTTETSDRRRRW